MSAFHPADEGNDEGADTRLPGEEVEQTTKSDRAAYCPDCGQRLPKEMRCCPDCGTTVADLPEWARWK